MNSKKLKARLVYALVALLSLLAGYYTLSLVEYLQSGKGEATPQVASTGEPGSGSVPEGAASMPSPASNDTSATAEPPYFLQAEFLSTSLHALEENGSDLSLPMPSKHRVTCETHAIADEVDAWGRANGFDVARSTFNDHGGVEFVDIELSVTEVPEIARIQRQGISIRTAVMDISGAVYSTWVGEIVRP